MKIFVTVPALKAALLHAADKDVRFYLNGVLVEATEKETRCVATDGHRCGIIRVAAANELDQSAPEPLRVSFIIPRDVVKALKAVRANSGPGTLTIQPRAGGDQGQWTITGTGVDVNFTQVDGVFPDYRRIVPEKTCGVLDHFRPDFLADCSAALRLLGSKEGMIRVHHNGGAGASLVTGDNPNYVGVVMGYRMTDFKTKEPLYMHDHTWAKAA